MSGDKDLLEQAKRRVQELEEQITNYEARDETQRLFAESERLKWEAEKEALYAAKLDEVKIPKPREGQPPLLNSVLEILREHEDRLKSLE